MAAFSKLESGSGILIRSSVAQSDREWHIHLGVQYDTPWDFITEDGIMP